MTEKQMDKILNRIWFHCEKLQSALNDAHSKNLIKYVDYTKESPCGALSEVRDRIRSTTEKQIARFIHDKFRQRHW